MLSWLLLSAAFASSGIKSEKFLTGVTVDRVDNVPEIVRSLKKIGKKPVVRIVFDEETSPSTYKEAVEKISAVGYVMGELVDSYELKNTSEKAYAEKAREFLSAFGSKVDLWEIGNEVNGDWTGDAKSVVKKISGAFDAVKKTGGLTALTLYYNDGCWEKKENEMFRWADKNIPKSMKSGLDYIFVSYYEDDCEGPKPEWEKVFGRLGQMFPRAKLGFGEVGTKAEDRKALYIRRYYGMKIRHPRFTGGYFWWYFSGDMVPAEKPLLKELVRARP